MNNSKQILKTRDISFIENEYPAKLLKKKTNDHAVNIRPNGQKAKDFFFNDVITLTTNGTMEGEDNIESERRETIFNESSTLSNADTSFQSMEEDIIELQKEKQSTTEVRRCPERERRNKEFPGMIRHHAFLSTDNDPGRSII